MTTPSANRLRRLQASIPDGETWLLATPTDICYLTGFVSLVPEERECFLILNQSTAWLLQASFSPTPEHSSELVIKMQVSPRALLTHLRDWHKAHPWQVLRVDMAHLTASEYQGIVEEKWQPQAVDSQPLWGQRILKDETELAALTKAGEIAIRSFIQIKNQLKVGMTEQEVMRQLEINVLTNGSSKPAFPTIVAFGEHGALPHHQPTSRQLTLETAILIDFGATVDGYRSDMTRSWWFGHHPPETFSKIEHLVKKSYELALHEMKVGAAVGKIDQAAREYLTTAGYGQHFIHTTGHGVGLDIHEPPSVYHPHQDQIKVGMVITIEPGIYLTDSFGYRYENTVAMLADGPHELTLETGVQ